MTDRENLNKLKDEYTLLASIINEDNFLVFREYLNKMAEDLNKEFTNGYHDLDDKRKAAVDKQAIFISRWNNIMDGIPNTVEQCKVQLEMLDEEEQNDG